MMANFQIVRGSPVHCQITDGIIGSRYSILPMTYFRDDYARKLAARLHEENYQNCGDDWFYVIRAGEKPLNRYGRENRAPALADLQGFTSDYDDDLPF